MSEPRVLYVIGQLVKGGAEQQLVNLLSHTAPPVTVVAFTTGDYWADPIRALGHRVIEMERRGRFQAQRLLRLRRIIRAERPDVVYVFIDGITGLYGRLGAMLALHPRVIIGLRSHTDYFPGWYRRLLPALNRTVAAVVCNSYTARDEMVARGYVSARKVHVIPNGIDVAHIAQAAADTAWPWPEAWRGKTVVGMVSHMTGPKSPETFIHLAAQVRSQRDDLRFALIGGGARFAEMRALAGSLGVEDVLWLAGERHDVPALLREMDIFVLTSRHEGMPNAVMEAMAAGRPCVVTDAGDSGRLVIEGDTGYVVPVGDVAALATRVRALAEDAALRQRMGAGGQARMQAEFDIPVMAARYRDLYAQLAHRA